MSLLGDEESTNLVYYFRDAIQSALADHAGEDPAVILYELQGLLRKAYIHERAYDKHLSFQLRTENEQQPIR